jgi:nucleotide-binding universal stress UspA family protein
MRPTGAGPGLRVMAAFETIVLGLDGSEGSWRALPVAVELARRDDAKLVLTHVEERIIAKGGMPPVYADEDEIRAEIEREANELSEQGIDASVRTSTIVLGGPAHALADIADEVGADLIVVGTRGHSALAGALLGSVTQRLLHISHRPVLAVPPSA